MKRHILLLTALIVIPTSGLQFIQVGHVTGNNDQWPPVTEILDIDSNVVCNAQESYFQFTANEDNQAGVVGNMICETIFDKGICCNGVFGSLALGQSRFRDLLNPSCGYLEGSGWTAIESMPEKLRGAASVALNNKRLLLVSGGQNVVRGYSDKMYALNESLNWNELDGVTMPRSRWRHCMVQIDEERVAIMGGINATHTSIIREVDIFDFDTNDWSEGPSLPEVSTLTQSFDCGCANLWDDQTIIWAGPNNARDIKHLYTWDYSNDSSDWTQYDSTVRIGRPAFRNLDNSTVIVAPRSQKTFRRFTLAGGFSAIIAGQTTLTHVQGGSLLLPTDTATCQT